MKKTIFVVIVVAAALTSFVGMASIQNFRKTPLTVRLGLYSALDADTGYDQIYYRSLNGGGVIKLTTTASDKTLPKWGPSGVTYYFYDRIENEILTCEGKLFYYLEASDTGKNDLLMGCLASDSSLDTIEGYPLTGFDAGPADIVSYEVAQGAELSYEYDGTTHEAYPVIVETVTEEAIVLHDDQANLGSSNYEDGFVMYYDDEGYDETVPGWTSSSDDDVKWNGSINCPRCDGNVAGGRPGNNDDRPREASDDEENENTESDTEIDLDYNDSDQTQETTQNSDQTTVVGNENQNTNSSGSSVTSDTSDTNEVNVNVTVEVNSTNANTSSSDSSSDYSGTVSSNSSNEENSSSPESTDPSASVSEGMDEINPDTSVPVSGGFQMVGGGGCSLSSAENPEFHWATIFVGLIFMAGLVGIRMHAYGQSV